MVRLAIELWGEKKYISEQTLKPVLYQKYYTDKEVRLKAVERHYEDLTRNEVGTKPIEYIFDYISNTPKIVFHKITLKKPVFDELLQSTIEKFAYKEEMKNQTIESLESLLITNGIVKKLNHGHGDVYKFAFLYKYRLGLKGV